MTQQQGAQRRHFWTFCPELCGYGVQPRQAFFTIRGKAKL